MILSYLSIFYLFILSLIGIATLFIPIAKYIIDHINGKLAAFVVFLVSVLILVIPYCFGVYYFFSRLL